MTLIEKRTSVWIALAIVLAATALATAYQAVQHVRAGASTAYGGASYLSAGTGAVTVPGQLTSTSTVTFLKTTDTASSTITGSMQGSTNLAVNFLAVASSTSALFNIAVDTSEDLIDWYPVDISALTATNEAALNGVDGIWPWTPGVTARTGKTIVFPGVAGKYYRVRVGVGAANASLWAMARPIVPIPN